jgi:hypothetical protein
MDSTAHGVFVEEAMSMKDLSHDHIVSMLGLCDDVGQRACDGL